MDNLKRILYHFYKPVASLGAACKSALKKRSEGGFISNSNPKGYLHLAQPVDVTACGRKGDSRPISGKNADPFFVDLEVVMTGFQAVEGLEAYLHEQAQLSGKSFSWEKMIDAVVQHRQSFDDYMAQYSADQAAANGKVVAPKPVAPKEEEEIGF